MPAKERCKKCKKSNCLKLQCKFCSNKYCTSCLLPETHECESISCMKENLLKRHNEKMNDERCVAAKMVKC